MHFLVFGGSQGAGFINEVFLDALSSMGEKAKRLQVIHLTGKATPTEGLSRFYKEKGISACVKPFEENMQLAWKIADVAVCRAGAATLSELVHFEVPSLLIPYPYAADAHQLKNALFMEEIGAAFCLEEKSVRTPNVRRLIEQFLDNDNDVIQTMKNSIAEFKKKQSACSLTDKVEEFLYQGENP